MPTITAEQYNQLKARLSDEQIAELAEKNGYSLPRKGFVERVGDALSQRGENIVSNIKRQTSVAQSSPQTARGAVEGAGRLASGVIGNLGQMAGAVGDVVGAGIDTLTFGGLSKIGEVIGKNETVQEKVKQYAEFKNKYPEAAQSLEGIVNVATLFPVGAAGEQAVQGVAKTALKAAQTLEGRVDNLVLEQAKKLTKPTGKEATESSIAAQKQGRGVEFSETDQTIAEAVARALPQTKLSGPAGLVEAERAVRSAVSKYDAQNKQILTPKDFSDFDTSARIKQGAFSEFLKSKANTETVNDILFAGADEGAARETYEAVIRAAQGLVKSPGLRGVFEARQALDGLSSATLTKYVKKKINGLDLTAKELAVMDARTAMNEFIVQELKRAGKSPAAEALLTNLAQETALLKGLGRMYKNGVQLAKQNTPLQRIAELLKKPGVAVTSGASLIGSTLWLTSLLNPFVLAALVTAGTITYGGLKLTSLEAANFLSKALRAVGTKLKKEEATQIEGMIQSLKEASKDIQSIPNKQGGFIGGDNPMVRQLETKLKKLEGQAKEAQRRGQEKRVQSLMSEMNRTEDDIKYFSRR
jgi:hypothetical protein